MALTLTDVATPNAAQHTGTMLGMKARIVDITFDASYLTTGEVLTAAQLGWAMVIGAVVLNDPVNAAGTLSVGCVVRKNTAGSQLAFQAMYGPTSVGPYPEATSTNDLSTYTGRFIVLGY